ncbi:MAG: NAD(P)H-hydrate dehydratase, partial [Clostridia bacterium]|nr:NAD(P)H-hydrate dehydratase [Clostridia bacterium]
GNNGGDGLAAARILLTRGYDVICGITGEPSTNDAYINAQFLIATGRLETIAENSGFIRTSGADVIIDALFGTGLKRRPSGLYEELINDMNAHAAKVVCADIPSGVFGDTGQCELGVYADTTVTFQNVKTGHLVFPGREHTGKLVTAKIGADDRRDAFNKFWADEIVLPPRKSNTNKGSFGKLSIIAGSKGMAGAAVLAAKAAVKAGCGLTRVGTTEFAAAVVQKSAPEATVKILGAEDIDPKEALGFTEGALAIGPGLGTNASVKETVRVLIGLELKKVIDADALNVMAEDKAMLESLKNAVITPHPKEFSRLSGMSMSDILSDPVKAAGEFALMYKTTVLLKGATTVVTDGKRTVIVTAGSPAMAKGGSGDVLTGVTGALLAQGYAPFEAAYTAAYFCGRAGERAAKEKGEYSASPLDTIENLFMGK